MFEFKGTGKNAEKMMTVSATSVTDFLKLPEKAKVELVCAYFKNTQLKDMGQVLTVLADVVYEYRLKHRGFVPIEVFEQLLGPVTVSVQIVHEVSAEDGRPVGFALRRRTQDEAGYAGTYHNTCCGLRWTDDLVSALLRDDEDAFKGKYEQPVEYLGVTYHHEAPRRNGDLTFMHLRRILETEVSEMDGEWKVFRYEEITKSNRQIVASNIAQLKWVMDAQRASFGVLTETFPRELLQ